MKGGSQRSCETDEVARAGNRARKNAEAKAPAFCLETSILLEAVGESCKCDIVVPREGTKVTITEMLIKWLEFVVAELEVRICSEHVVNANAPAAVTVAPTIVSALEATIATSNIKAMSPERGVNRSITECEILTVNLPSSSLLPIHIAIGQATPEAFAVKFFATIIRVRYSRISNVIIDTLGNQVPFRC